MNDVFVKAFFKSDSSTKVIANIMLRDTWRYLILYQKLGILGDDVGNC